MNISALSTRNTISYGRMPRYDEYLYSDADEYAFRTGTDDFYAEQAISNQRRQTDTFLLRKVPQEEKLPAITTEKQARNIEKIIADLKETMFYEPGEKRLIQEQISRLHRILDRFCGQKYKIRMGIRL